MIDWNKIDTVLLDMDGTLLDKHHDDHLWEFLVPEAYARMHGIAIEQATKELKIKYSSAKGTMLWSDMNHWSKETGTDIRKLRENAKHLIQVHPHTIRFLEFLRTRKKKVFLVTAAPMDDVEFKLTNAELKEYFDAIYSQIEINLPKESPKFWRTLQKLIDYDPDTTLLAEDNENILEAAKLSGIKHLVFKKASNSQKPPKELINQKNTAMTEIHHFDEIIPR
ncbi:MAG: HAD-IA family hydrolase [Candidatus Aenigmarchaeota archaeon]|nr:HAD-IA family hydrolase [Candidatus Aenigmarchaeota archaeon]